MRNALYVGLCWAMTLGLVAVALGQQLSSNPFQDSPLPAPQAVGSGPSGQAFQPLQPPAVSRQPEEATHSLLTGRPSTEPVVLEDSRPRGELGVWMGESGGPGVRLIRVNSGSAAEQAGLRVGDIILQVNGQGASSPLETAKLIKQIGVGGTGSLMVWRNGNQQQVQVSLHPAREIARATSQQVRFDAPESSTSDLASRTNRLEQQVASLTQELAALRQDLTQFRTNGPVQTDYRVETGQIAPPQDSARSKVAENPTPAPAAATPLFLPAEEKPAKPATEVAKPTPPPQPAPPAAQAPKPAPTPATPPAPAAEKSEDLFGPTSTSPPSGEKPKTEEKPKANDQGASDDLFK